MNSGSDEQTPVPGTAPLSQPPRHGPPWGWIAACVLLLILAGGLAIWAFGLDSKLDDQRDQTAAAQQQADQAQQQADQATEQAQSLSGEIDEINASVAEAGEQISETGAEAQSKVQTTLDEIKAKLESMKAELNEDAQASGGSGNSGEGSAP